MKKVIVLEDQLYQNIIKEILEKENFQVVIALDLVDLINKIYSEPYDLIILDYESDANKNFLTYIEEKNPLLCCIPILYTSSKSITSFEGCVYYCDYIVKPFPSTILLLKVDTLLKKVLPFHPLTQFERGESLQKILKEKITSKEDFAFLCCELLNIKKYEKNYGEIQTNNLIKMTAEILKKTLQKYGVEKVFHLCDKSFCFICNHTDVDIIGNEIINTFEEKIKDFYIVGNVDDSEKVKIALVGFTTSTIKFDNLGKIYRTIEELLFYVNRLNKSIFFLERRKRI